MRKVLFILLLILFAIGGGIIGTYILLKQMDIKEYLSSHYENVNLDIKISNISVFPYPYIQVENINVKPYLQANQGKIFISLSSLLSLKPTINRIELYDGSVNLKANDQDLKNNKQFVANILNLKIPSQEILLKDMEIDGLFGEEIVQVNHLVITKNKNTIGFTAVTSSNKNYSFLLENNESDNSIKLSNDSFSLVLNKNNNTNRKLIFEITNFKNFYNNYLSNVDSKDNNFNDATKLKISANIVENDNNFILKNFEVSSNILDKIEGQITFNQETFGLKNIQLKFGTFNYGEIFKQEALNLIDFMPKSNIFFRQKGDASFNITIDNLIFSAEYKLENIKAEGEVKNNVMELRNIQAKFGPQGVIFLSGKATQDSFRPSFEGNINLDNVVLEKVAKNKGDSKIAQSDNKLNFAAKFVATEKEFSLSNIQAKIKDFSVSGNMAIKFIGFNPRIQSNLVVNNFNFSDSTYPYFNDIIGNLKSFLWEIKKPTFQQTLNILRTNNYYSHLNILFLNSKIDDQIFETITLSLATLPNSLKINNFKFIKGVDSLALEGQLSCNSIIPELTLNVKEGNIQVGKAEEVIKTLQNFLLNSYDPDKLLLNITGANSALNLGDRKIENLSFKIFTQNKLINAGFSGKLFEGILSATANVVFEPFQINLAYALNNFHLNKLGLPSSLIKNGVGSISGSTIIGDKSDEISSKGTFIAKEIDLQNFALDKFVLEITLPSYNVEKIEEDALKLLNAGETNVDSMQGKYIATSKAIALSDVTFSTNYASGALSAVFDGTLNTLKANTKFSFFPSRDNSTTKAEPINFSLTAEGNINNIIKKYELNEVKQFYQAKK
ncbi:MAG: hypothetical protein K0R02_940 [Rickettsiaceae bacterium]|jgi:hypothetical protein|nr:hypothetical protein [Rickettsiaceae bacterium]